MSIDDRIAEIEESETDSYVEDLQTSVINLITGGTKIGIAQCDACQCRWVALYCEGIESSKQCPNCLSMGGKIVEQYTVTKLNS